MGGEGINTGIEAKTKNLHIKQFISCLNLLSGQNYKLSFSAQICRFEFPKQKIFLYTFILKINEKLLVVELNYYPSLAVCSKSSSTSIT